MNTPQKEQFNMRIPSEVKEDLRLYAKMVNRTNSFVAADALSHYLSWRIPQIDDLRKAMRAADRGEFASKKEVSTLYKKYGS